jgi:hypothetical protein
MQSLEERLGREDLAVFRDLSAQFRASRVTARDYWQRVCALMKVNALVVVFFMCEGLVGFGG